MDAAPLTVAKPPVLDRLVAAIAGAITTLLVLLRLAGITPDLDVPPDLVLGFVTSVATIAALLRNGREQVGQRNAAEVVTALLEQVTALRERVALMTPVPSPFPETPSGVQSVVEAKPVIPPPPVVGSQSGRARVGIMAWLAVLSVTAIAIAGSGCAHGGPSFDDATKGANLAVGFVREASTTVGDIHRAGTDAAIAACRGGATPEARERCLTQYGFSPEQISQHEAAFVQLAAAYDALVVALDSMTEAWRVLEPMVQRAKAVPR